VFNRVSILGNPGIVIIFIHSNWWS